MNAGPRAGRLLDGRYRVGTMIARGGMSTVHRGTDTRLDRPVAIKVMDARLAGDPAFRTRFQREARSAARIDHPAVVDVHDQGADPEPEPVLFLVMELVEGGTLRDVLRSRGAIGVAETLAVMEPVLSGLAEAHRLGMVHRDVKPENVLISRAGEVKVADFGLVTAAAGVTASHAGMIMGTVAYLSPEQVTTGAADARSDVYAAGIVLYELLTGAPPFSGDTPISVAYRHVNSAVPAPSLVAAAVPPELDALVLRATDRDPDLRFADADALLAQLLAVREQLGVPHVPTPLPPLTDEQDTVPSPAAQAGAAGPGPGGTRTLARPQATGVLPLAAAAALPTLGGRRRGRRVVAAWTAVVLVLALLIGAVTWWLGTGRWTAMPSVVGLDRAAAERLLTDADLVATVTPAFSDAVAAGVVAAADPPPQAQLLRGSEVRLTVSSGRPKVPAVARGTAVEVAERLVRDAGLSPVRDTGADTRRSRSSDNSDSGDGDSGDSDSGDGDSGRTPARDSYDPDLPVGSVLRTDPQAGTVLAVGAPVALILNVAEEQITVPFLIGRKAKDARKQLHELDLHVQVRSGLPFGLGGGNGGNGTVISQSPAPGTPVERGTTVVLGTL